MGTKEQPLHMLGKPVADALQAELLEQTKRQKERGVHPKLVMVRVGDSSADIAYEIGATKKMASIGILVEHIVLAQDCTQKKLEELLETQNTDETVHGILVFRPLPRHLDETRVMRLINPEKDVDCMNPLTFGGLLQTEKMSMMPCTAQAVIETLRHYKIELVGKEVVVLGRSNVIGKPVALLLLQEDATVTVCHSKTKGMQEIVSRADIVVSAMGRAKMLDTSYFKKGAIVVDVGMNVDEGGRLCGDVDFEAVQRTVGAITPVPRGVGSVTTTILAQNLLYAIEKRMDGIC